MIKIRYTNCAYCLERQDVGGVFPHTRITCIKCGERFAVPDPRFTGRRGLLRRLAGLSGILAGVVIMVGVLHLQNRPDPLRSLRVEPMSYADAPPELTPHKVSSPKLRYSLPRPGKGWSPVPSRSLDGALQFRFVHAQWRAAFEMGACRVSPALDLDALQKASIHLESGAFLLFLRKAAGRDLEMESFAFRDTGRTGLVEFDFTLFGRSYGGENLTGQGMLIPAGDHWFWFYITAPPDRLANAVMDVETLLKAFAVK